MAQENVFNQLINWPVRLVHWLGHTLRQALRGLKLKLIVLARGSQSLLGKKVIVLVKKGMEVKKRSEKIESHLKKSRSLAKRQEKTDKEFVAGLKKPLTRRMEKLEPKKHEKMEKAVKVLKKEIKAGKKELKVKKVMREYKKGDLHSGSKKGPRVTNEKQAIAIALNEARKAVKKPARKKK